MLIATEVKRKWAIKFTSQCTTSEIFIIYNRQTIHKHFIIDLLSEAASGRNKGLMGEVTIETNTRKKTWIWDTQKKLKTCKSTRKAILYNFFTWNNNS